MRTRYPQRGCRKQVLFLLLLAVFFCAPLIAQEAGGISLNESDIDLGEMPQYSSRDFAVTVNNTTDTTITITKIRFSCNCSSATRTPIEIKPKRSKTLSLHVRSSGDLGSQGSLVAFHTDYEGTPILFLKMKYTVTQYFKHLPERLFYEDVVHGKPQSVKFVVKRMSGEPLDDAFALQYNESIFKSAKGKFNATKTSLHLNLEMDGGDLPAGPFRSWVTITFGEKDKREYRIRIKGTIASAIKMTPDKIAVEDIQRGDPLRVSILLSSKKDKSFTLLKAQPDLARIRIIEINQISKSKTRVDLALDTSPNILSYIGSVTFQTDMPFQPKLKLPIEVIFDQDQAR